MYETTGAGEDTRGAEVVIITCQACGYNEEHFTDRDMTKVGKPCDRCRK